MMLRRLLREPLLQFLVYGAMLFLLQSLYGAALPDDTQRIEVSSSRVAAIREALRMQLKREPSAAELQAGIGHWVDEELLVRAAQQLQLDRADTIVRRRLVQKMETLIALPAESETPDDAQLQALLEADPQRYGRPARYSFEHVMFSRGLRGAGLHADAQAALQQLRADPRAADRLGDAFFAGRELHDQDAQALRKIFGREIAAAVAELPVGDWQGPIVSGYGLHLLRVTQRTSFQPASLAAVRERLRIDWTESRRRELLREQLAALREGYRIVIAADEVGDGRQLAEAPRHVHE